MASIRSLNTWRTIENHLQICSKHVAIQVRDANQLVLSMPISRRSAILVSSLPFTFISLPQSSEARDRRNRKAVPLEDYLTTRNGPVAEKGSTVQPYEFKVGAPPGKERKREFVDNPNGLFSAQAAPKPPPAMYSVTEGMKVGGKRTVIVPPEAGYGKKGMNEIPPGSTFELNIELLEVISPEGK
ncbi:peptidyl-prolyl cis-trans isomerase FKBP18, chloroplastic isoform X4 [Mangifera indica]|uniref:peptidyl-prolyl cis-trans isomerase FKBP18, chloroplastic isoform X4 n=1 Tax=Mangifera indica TaxID=29780 RepID=UPI001CFB3767|nr:peptidyl-prolyl cis-trans isomerase FKBP18, chloroplastic isoform X4 [Mangifera indica]